MDVCEPRRPEKSGWDHVTGQPAFPTPPIALTTLNSVKFFHKVTSIVLVNHIPKTSFQLLTVSYASHNFKEYKDLLWNPRVNLRLSKYTLVDSGLHSPPEQKVI